MRYQPRLRSLGPVARVDMVTRVILFTGVVLFAFTGGHLANHAAGLWSLEAMEAGRRLANAVWRGPLGSMLLFGSLTVHATFGLWRLYRRRTLRVPWWEAAQIATGVAIPFLLAAHVLETRMLAATFRVDDDYAYMLLRAWPERAAGLLALLMVSWLHGCLGIHYWLRLRPWYAAARPAALALALLLPALALLGLGRGLAEVQALAADPAWLLEAREIGRWPNRFAEAVANTYELYALSAYGAAVALVLAARALRGVLLMPRGRVRVALGDGRAAVTRIGATVLDACREAGIPLAAPCGGRGRCAGCRVRIDRGVEGLAPPDDDERRVLALVGASPRVRLACRIRPRLDVAITPLLPPLAAPAEAGTLRPFLQGRQQDVAILASAAPDPAPGPPADAVALVNVSLRRFGRAVRAMGGVPDPAFADAQTALFGLHKGAAAGTAAAVAAAFQVLRGADLAGEPPLPMALHTGPAVVAEFGRGDPDALSAVGVAVRVARRMLDVARDAGCQLVVSEPARASTGFDLRGFRRRRLPIAGWDKPITVYLVQDYRELAAAIVAQVGPPPALPPRPWRRWLDGLR